MKNAVLPYLFVRGRSYYFRIVIPKKLQNILGRAEYKRALKTRDISVAKRKCFRMSEAALSAFEELNKIVMSKPLNDSTIKEMVRNHFEKRLLDAAEERF